MKKIKILNGFVILLIGLYFISFGTNIYYSVSSEFKFLYAGYENTYFGSYTPFIPLYLSILLIVGLIYLQQGLTIIINHGLFNKKGANRFKKAGLFFMISGVLNILYDLTIFWAPKASSAHFNLEVNLLKLIIAFSLYIIGDIIDRGNMLKQENDLTI